MVQELDKNAIQDYLDFLGFYGNPEIDLELRMINKNHNPDVLNFFQNHFEKIRHYNGLMNVYFGINPRCKGGTKISDIVFLANFGIDVDAGINHKDQPSTEEEKQVAFEIVKRIKKGIERQTGALPLIIDSGNGYQMIYSLPWLELNEKNRHEVNEKVKAFIEVLGNTFNNEIVTIDQTGDLSRVLRVPGTINLKGNKFVKIVENPKRNENEKLRDSILSLDLSERVTVGKIDFDLDKYWKTDPIAKDLFEGKLLHFKSRSEAEQSLVFRLIMLGLDKDQIFKVMASSHLGKWSEKNITYRNMTYDKAVAQVTIEKQVKVEERPKDSQSQILDIKDFNYFRRLKQDKSFFVEDFLYPKTVVMVYSPPAQFKSLFVAYMGLALSNGKDFLRLRTKRVPVLYCDGENSENIIKERLIGLHKGMLLKRKTFPFYILKRGIILDEKKNVNLRFLVGLEQAIEKYKIKVLVFDTLHRFCYYDENKSDDLNKVYTLVFQPLIEKYGITIIFLHHSRKDGGYRGSGDFLGMVDSCYSVVRDGKSSRFRVINEKSRSGEIGDIQGEIDFGEDYIKIIRRDELKENEDKISKIKATTSKIKELLEKCTKLNRKEILDYMELEGFDFNMKTVQRSLKYLVENKFCDKDEKGVFTWIIR